MRGTFGSTSIFVLALSTFTAGAVGCGVLPGHPTGAGGTGGQSDGGSGADSGADGGLCSRTDDDLTLRITNPDGLAIDCEAAFNGAFGQYPPEFQRFAFDLQGRVTQVTPGAFTLDSCAPETGCQPSRTTFAASARGVEVSVPLGSAVHVQAEISALFGCVQWLEVEALASFGATPNRTQPRAGLLLAAYQSGAPGTYNGMPNEPGVLAPPEERPHFFVTTLALGCNASPGCNIVPADDYAFVFAPKTAPDRRVQVNMGETKSIDLLEPGGAGSWIIRNLKSYQTRSCDDYWNFAYYVSAAH
jgi:hypothetical protein